MKPDHVWRMLFLITAVALVVGLLAFTSGLPARQNQTTFSLIRPPFMTNAHAEANLDIGAFLDQEAGISAWLNSGMPINLTNAATAFRVIEDQTSEYIIGSVDLPNYTEHYDAHVYVHVDGWILAYYLRPDPASKIIAIREGTISTTNLASIVGIVAGAAGVPSSGINYYDFRYPNAQKILFVYEDIADGNDFTINLPSTFAYYDRGWAIYSGGYDVYFKLDGTNLQSTYSASGGYYGVISAAQLAPDVTHTINVDDYGVLMIIYTEP